MLPALIFIIIYFVFVISSVIYLIDNNKVGSLKISYKALENICKAYDEQDINILSKEIKRFYDGYVREDAHIEKFFPNVILWLDAIIFRIDSGNKKLSSLKEYEDILKSVRDQLEKQNPFNKCEKYQQDILYDLSKIEANEIVKKNIIKRTENEFVRLTTDIKKNERNNKISILIGITGILVSIIMAVITFNV